MVLPRFTLLAMSLPLAAAFQNTSPFFLSSTAQVPVSSLDGQLVQSGSSILSSAKDLLSSCPSDTYILIEQPGASSLDFAAEDATPNLRNLLQTGASSATVPNVLGKVDANEIARWLSEKCDASVREIDINDHAVPTESPAPRIIHAQLPALPVDDLRANVLLSHDGFLNTVLSAFDGQSVTVLYTTTPPPSSYLPPRESAHDPMAPVFHEELKRDVHARESNDTLPKGGLFERYQFFNPGIFMGLLVAILLLLILYVGITALSSLQVSYFAFSREMGPGAQKKTQ